MSNVKCRILIVIFIIQFPQRLRLQIHPSRRRQFVKAIFGMSNSKCPIQMSNSKCHVFSFSSVPTKTLSSNPSFSTATTRQSDIWNVQIKMSKSKCPIRNDLFKISNLNFLSFSTVHTKTLSSNQSLLTATIRQSDIWNVVFADKTS